MCLGKGQHSVGGRECWRVRRGGLLCPHSSSRDSVCNLPRPDLLPTPDTRHPPPLPQMTQMYGMNPYGSMNMNQMFFTGQQ
jgi:hypothetical protein